jgi:uncharacterized protein YndB with AHSA1/START domain
MFKLDEARSIDRPAGEVWAVLVDFQNVPLWEDGVLEVRQTSDGRPALGTTFVARRVFGGRESMVDCRIIEWEDGHVATMEIIGGPVRRAAARYLVEPTSESACRVEYSINGELQPRLAWLTPLVPLMGRRLVRSNLARLERLVEDRAKTRDT